MTNREEKELAAYRSCLLAALLPFVICLGLCGLGIHVKRELAQQDVWENDSPALPDDGFGMTEQDWEMLLMSEDEWWYYYYAGLVIPPVDSDLPGAPDPFADPINP